MEGDSDHLRLGTPELFLRAPVYLTNVAFSEMACGWHTQRLRPEGTKCTCVRSHAQKATKSGRTQVSTAGGQFPVWGRTAPGTTHELFFLGLDGRIMVSDYTANRDSFTASKPQVWSEKAVARTLGFYSYAMAADGRRAAVLLYPGETAEPQQRPTDSVTVVLNFFGELRRRVPGGSSVERLQQIEEIFQAALQREPAERDVYVREACRGDTELEHEVSCLLANHHEASDFAPWAAAAAAQLVERTSMQPGQCLGPYRIESFLAAGGMGEVYRATDTRLNRPVAIKVSAERFSKRFEREARVIASLNHPNICTLYDVGPNYLVMEYVEGPTLAERIQRGPMPLAEALDIARQMVAALEEAHQRLVVHRDFKPGNVKIKPDGTVKGRPEIYVAPFPGPGGKRRISTGGGAFPRWRADSKEIFYELNGTLMAAEVSIKGASIEPGPVHSLGISVSAPFYQYDVSADGQRFLVATPREQKSPAPLTLVQNWTTLLKKK